MLFPIDMQLIITIPDISLDELVNGDPAFDKAQTNSEQKTSDSLKRISYEIATRQP